MDGKTYYKNFNYYGGGGGQILKKKTNNNAVHGTNNELVDATQFVFPSTFEKYPVEMESSALLCPCSNFA